MTDWTVSRTSAGTVFRAGMDPEAEVQDIQPEGGEGLERMQPQVDPLAMFRMLQEQQQEQQRVLEMVRAQQEEQHAYRQEMEELRHREVAERQEETRYKLPKPTLKKLEETDDIENYLKTFKRVATQHHWPEEMWAAQLAGLLTGRAQAAYANLSALEAQDYKKVKETILHRYDVNQETHRRRFRQDRKKPEESYREWICRISNHFEK